MKSFKKDEIGYVQLYKKIKKRCQFQLNFSCFLLVLFFVLQYSVPICLVFLGSLTTSREQVASLFFHASKSKNIETEKLSEQDDEAENSVSKIIFFLGLVTILLGVINNTIRPAESYDTCSNYNNQFNKFLIDLDLDLIKLGGLPEKSPINSQAQEVDLKLIYQVLIDKNNELFKLIDDYNKARSLTPRQANMKAINQKDDEPSSKNTNSASSEASDDNTRNSLADTPNTLNESSNGTSNKSLVEIPNTSN